MAGTSDAEVTVLCWERKEGQIRFSIWFYRDCLDDLNPYLLFWAFVFLGARYLACEAACTIFVVD